MKEDKADKIIKKAELKAKKAAQQVQIASKKAEIARKKQAAQAQKKAARAADAATKKAAAKTKKAEAAAKKAQLAAKKAEEKKAKAIAKAAAKAAASTGAAGGGEGGAPAGKKKPGKKKLLMIAIPVLAAAVGVGAFFFLKGRGGEQEEEEGPPQPISAPAEYVLNEGHIPALPVWGDEVLVYREELKPEPAEPPAEPVSDTEDGEGGGADDAGAKPAEAEPAEGEEDGFTKILYRYEGLRDPGKLVTAYAAMLLTEDAGFSTVDETLLRIDPPELEGMNRGSVQLARNVPQAEDGTGGGVQSLLLSWDTKKCSVTLDMPEGRVHDPKPEPPAAAVTRGLSDLEELHPSMLGLPGESMDEYELVVQDGSVRIAGSVCVRVNIYDGNHQIAGSYFVSKTGKLYRLEEDVNGVVELEWE